LWWDWADETREDECDDEDKDFSCSDDALDGDSTLTWTSSLIEFREEFLLLDLLELLDFFARTRTFPA